ncbi:MAG: hypothetical protein ACOX1Q_11245 [Eubacteriales bacterium]
MDSDGWLRILSLVALTLGAAYFAATETSFAAMNKLRIQNPCGTTEISVQNLR